MQQNPDPEAAKRRTQRLDYTLAAVALLILALVVFQVFLRYQYVHAGGMKVVRVDRVTGDSCVMPCHDNSGGYGPYYAAYQPPPTPRPDKSCHAADVVRVSSALPAPPDKTPTPYAKGGRRWIRGRRPASYAHPLPNAVELSDGHIYTFNPDAFSNDVATWTTGQEVQVCATWSRLEHRPFYSVGSADDGDPATLAL